jgi:GT2 family glycosyltransferase
MSAGNMMALSPMTTARRVGSNLSRPVTILIPAYGAAEKLLVCLRSLADCLPTDCAVIVLDDASPGESVRDVCADPALQALNLHYVRSPENRGFVKTCNWGHREFRVPQSDLLLLNSDTEVTSGFLQEMQAVLDLHEKHAVISPRSNNATIFSVPFEGERLLPEASYQLWQVLQSKLPRYQMMPTVVGFCMLIKSDVLERFELFDEVYSPGYNEENDFVCRINRYGYSAVSANWAFVFHHESSSFGSRRAELEEAHRKILIERYPEYPRKVSDFFEYYVDPVERFASLFALQRPRILIDLFHLPPSHNGTSEFALNLLRAISQAVDDRFDLYVGIGSSISCFAAELRGYQVLNDASPQNLTFHLAFKPAQFFKWSDFERLNRRALRIAFTLQDIIGVRCDYLSSPQRHFLFSTTAELSDHMFTISQFSSDDALAFYGNQWPMQVIHHGTHREEEQETKKADYVLLVGNHYVHKAVEDALEYLGDTRPITLLGGVKGDVNRPNVRQFASGQLTRQFIRQLFLNASVVLYPSHYEGFGLPVLDTLALGKPVIALDTAVNRELREMVQSPNLHLIGSLKDLPKKLDSVLQQYRVDSPRSQVRSWHDAGRDYVESFAKLLSSPIDLQRLRSRWTTLRLMSSRLAGDAEE